ncbi:hypothetical protein [Bacteroides ovatus]|uniref:hypothetical protein n=1 Tax=Bacteroides ovatus TaxID=28116 RepID=UPI0021645A1A|nr:hypothetical protein [Bacteroides ovatus]UVQ31349.1 hypothetical protein NXW12_22675 [Bacteroides ovatus]
MKSELMSLFGDQLCWFIRLERKQRFCVLYFCLSFGALLSVFFIHPLPELLVVLNFGNSVRLLKKHVPLSDLED